VKPLDLLLGGFLSLYKALSNLLKRTLLFTFIN